MQRSFRINFFYYRGECRKKNNFDEIRLRSERNFCEKKTFALLLSLSLTPCNNTIKNIIIIIISRLNQKKQTPIPPNELHTESEPYFLFNFVFVANRRSGLN